MLAISRTLQSTEFCKDIKFRLAKSCISKAERKLWKWLKLEEKENKKHKNNEKIK